MEALMKTMFAILATPWPYLIWPKLRKEEDTAIISALMVWAAIIMLLFEPILKEAAYQTRIIVVLACQEVYVSGGLLQSKCRRLVEIMLVTIIVMLLLY